MKNAYVALAIVIIVAGVAAAAFAVQKPQDYGTMTTSGLLNEASPILGSADAQITIIEWGDYQCEFCHRFYQNTLDTIKSEYVDTGVVNIVFRDFVLNGPDSALAAHATHCAEDQDALYENWGGERTGWITDNSLLAIAVSLGLDTELFESCMDSNEHAKRVRDSFEYGKSIGVGATPTFLISNGEDIIKISGAQPLEVFARAIESL